MSVLNAFLNSSAAFLALLAISAVCSSIFFNCAARLSEETSLKPFPIF
jgi:hypothetical protein